MYAQHLSDKDIKLFADRSIDLIKCYDIEDLPFKMMSEAIRDTYEKGERLQEMYKELIDSIEFLELMEDMEICTECGHLPETGACEYCKQD